MVFVLPAATLFAVDVFVLVGVGVDVAPALKMSSMSRIFALVVEDGLLVGGIIDFGCYFFTYDGLPSLGAVFSKGFFGACS